MHGDHILIYLVPSDLRQKIHYMEAITLGTGNMTVYIHLWQCSERVDSTHLHYRLVRQTVRGTFDLGTFVFEAGVISTNNLYKEQHNLSRDLSACLQDWQMTDKDR